MLGRGKAPDTQRRTFKTIYMQQESDVPFQRNNIRSYVCTTKQRLRDIRLLPWPIQAPGFSHIEHVWEIMEQILTRSPAALVLCVNTVRGIE